MDEICPTMTSAKLFFSVREKNGPNASVGEWMKKLVDGCRTEDAFKSLDLQSWSSSQSVNLAIMKFIRALFDVALKFSQQVGNSGQQPACFTAVS